MSNNPRDSTFKGKGNSHSPSLPDQSGEASGSNNPNPNPNFNPSASTLDSTCRPPPSTNRNLPDNRRQYLPSANRYIPPGSVASGQRNGFAGSSSSAAAAASGIGSNRAGREDREMTEAERQRERERKHQREQDRLSENERSREREAEKQRQRERSNASNSFSMRPSGSNLNLDVNSFQDSKPIPQVRPSNNAPSAVRKAVEISKGSEGGITSINQRPSQFTSDRITDDVLSKDVDRSLEIRENGAERMGMDIDLDSGLDFIDPSRLVGGNMMMENQDLDGSRMVDHRQGREGFAGGGTHSFQPLASSSIFQPQQALNSVPMQNSNSNNSSKNLTFNQNGNAVPQEDTSSRFMTGLVYSTEMMKHSNSNEEDHPEAPERIFKIFNTINQAGLVKRMKRIKIRECVKQEVELIHHTQVWAGAEASAFFSREQLNLHWETTDRYRSLYLNEHTAQCARLSCGGVIEMCDAVASRKVRNGFAIVRPPGHHAEPDASMGFCFYNNVAVAAAWLLKRYSLEELSPSILSSSSDSSTPTKNSIPRPRNLIEKILIVDWDVHHGNGTQKAFYSNPNVLYISIHRYENGTFYPGTTLGGANMIGESEGEGFNINIPWPCSNMGDGEYLKAFYEVIMPVTMEFNPDFVIISAGFDAARGDQLGECDITPQGFAHLTQMLASLADGRCVAALEGGYNIDSISSSALEVTRVLLGDPAPPLERAASCTALANDTIRQVARIQSKYWSLISKSPNDPQEDDFEADRYFDEEDEDERMDDRTMNGISNAKNIIQLPDLIKKYRKEALWDDYRLIELNGLNLEDPELDGVGTFTSTSAALNRGGSAFASEDILNGDLETLVFFVHDLGTLRSERYFASVRAQDELNYVMDSSRKILDWTKKMRYGVIDLSLNSQLQLSNEILPSELRFNPQGKQNATASTQSSTSSPSFSSASSPANTPTLEEKTLTLHLWDSFVELSGSRNIVLVGHGNGCELLMSIINERRVESKVKAVVMVLSQGPLPLIGKNRLELKKWYNRTSLIITPQEHPYFNEDSQRQFGNRLGKVQQSDEVRPTKVLSKSFSQIKTFIESRLERRSSTNGV